MLAEKRKVILFRPVASATYRQGEMPLQLLAIARMLIDRYDVRIITAELGMERKSDAALREAVRESLDDCLFFGVTAMTGHGIRQALTMTRFVREASPDTKTVWGGWHTSLLPEQTLEDPAIDFVVVGQGEQTAAELAQALDEGAPEFSGIQGLGWKQDGQVRLNGPRPLADINEFPPLPYHLLDDVAFEQGDNERSAAILSSVGCPMNCGFCADHAVYGGNWNGLTAERTLDEIRALRDRYGVTSLRILDSNFFPDWKRGIVIIRGIRDLGMRAQWVNARIPKLLAADKDDLRLFRDTVDFFLVGAESGSDQALELINKHQTVESVRRVSRMYAEYDVPISFAAMVGLPLDDPEAWKQEFAVTVALLDEVLRAGNFRHKAQLHVYTPYPGTPLYAKAVAQGFEPPDALEGWADMELFTANLPYLPPGLGERVEFLTTFVLQLLWPKYRFYRGANPVAKAAFGVVQSLLTVLARTRWNRKYFDHPVEFRLVRRLLESRRQAVRAS